MKQPEMLQIFKKTEALLEGHFKLSSGRHADKYIQCAKALQYPEYADVLGQNLADIFKDKTPDLVVSPALGGLIIGHEVASALGVRFVFTERKEGRMTIRRGFEINNNERVIIIEDVITTGKSTSEVVSVISGYGAEVSGIGCLANRSTTQLNLPSDVHSLLRLTFENWSPDDCPLCQQNIPLTSPGSRFSQA